MTSRQFHAPDGIAPPNGNAYSHAVSAGGVIYAAGQIGVDPSGEIVEGFETQSRRCHYADACSTNQHGLFGRLSEDDSAVESS